MSGRYLIVVILLAVSVAGYGLDCGGNKRVVITGRIDSIADGMARTITAIDCNPGGIESGRHAVRVDSAGRFETYVNLQYGHNFTIYYNGKFMCLYAEPGDTLSLEINAVRSDEGPRCFGDHAEFNNEYSNAYASLFKTFFGDQLPPDNSGMKQFMNVFMAAYDRKLHAINMFADSLGLGDDSRKLIQKTALFTLANDAIGFRGKSVEDALDFFSAPIFGLDDCENLKEMMFPYHLYSYLNRLEEAVATGSPDDMVKAVVSRHARSINRDVMFSILSGREIFSDYQIDRTLFADASIYDALYGNKQHSAMLPSCGELNGGIYRYADRKVEKCGYADVSELLQNECKGKLVYLDLWATWCGPCLAANKELPAVAEYFKDNDRIVFVGIALKSDFDKWKGHVEMLPDNCHSYIVDDDDAAELIMSGLKMTGFPSYRVIYQNGIIDSKPPRPNNPAIYDYISDLLEN